MVRDQSRVRNVNNASIIFYSFLLGQTNHAFYLLRSEETTMATRSKQVAVHPKKSACTSKLIKNPLSLSLSLRSSKCAHGLFSIPGNHADDQLGLRKFTKLATSPVFGITAAERAAKAGSVDGTEESEEEEASAAGIGGLMLRDYQLEVGRQALL